MPMAWMRHFGPVASMRRIRIRSIRGLTAKLILCAANAKNYTSTWLDHVKGCSCCLTATAGVSPCYLAAKGCVSNATLSDCCSGQKTRVRQLASPLKGRVDPVQSYSYVLCMCHPTCCSEDTLLACSKDEATHCSAMQMHSHQVKRLDFFPWTALEDEEDISIRQVLTG